MVESMQNLTREVDPPSDDPAAVAMLREFGRVQTVLTCTLVALACLFVCTMCWNLDLKRQVARQGARIEQVRQQIRDVRSVHVDHAEVLHLAFAPVAGAATSERSSGSNALALRADTGSVALTGNTTLGGSYSGTANTIPKATGAQTLGASTITDDGTTITVDQDAMPRTVVVKRRRFDSYTIHPPATPFVFSHVTPVPATINAAPHAGRF